MPETITLKVRDASEFTKEREAVANINSEMCVNCGVCRRACPTEAIGEMQRDICRICPDCAPKKPKMFPEESKRFAPEHSCSLQCPLGTVPEGYVNMIAEGKFVEAYDLITELNPLPLTCSMICHHPCEGDCKRGLLRDEPIAIRALKRFVTERVEPKELKYNAYRDIKIAVIGAGPAGLVAAADLASKGYKVKIFEAGSEPGGMVKRAIPEFRIDKERFAKEAQRLIDAGIEIEYGCAVGKKPSVKDLLDEKFAAVLIAVGAGAGTVLPIPGASSECVYDALTLMKHVNGKKTIQLGKKAVVIGGGSVALDAARTLRRLGLEATCACLESGADVPAPAWELAEAAEEGVKLIEGVSPKSIVAEFFTVKGVELAKVERIDRDENGRIKPVIAEGGTTTLECDTVIFATGQRSETRYLAEGGALKTDAAGRIAFDSETLVTSDPKVFVAGDVVEARGSVISAMASGRRAALSIDNLLMGRELTDRAARKQPSLAPNSEKIFPAVRLEKLDPQPLEKNRFRDTFDLVEGVFDEQTAVLEAKRCMKCGYSSVTPERCIGCGMCSNLCPAKAITMVKA